MPSLAKLESIIADVTGGAEADSAPETQAGAPPTGEPSGAESAPEAESVSTATTAAHAPADDTPSGATITPEQQARRDLFAEKLRETRERREAQRLAARAREAAKQAEADREAAAKERASWESVRGNYKEGLAKVGADPQAVLREMVQQATEDGKPEVLIERMKADFQKRLDALEAERKAEREALEQERIQAQLAARAQRFQGDFQRAIALPEFQSLRVEYDDPQVYEFANHLRQNPTQMVQLAREFGVALQSPGKGFTMKEILSVLKGQQARHEAQRQARAQKLAGATSGTPEQASSENQTVNGTADRRNAGASKLGNDLASTRASDSAQRTTRAQRVQSLIDKG